jgi:hypothetical protein
MEAIEVAEQIQKKINLLEKARSRIKPLAEDKAHSISDYRRALAVVTMELKNGKEIIFGGQRITNPPATIIPTISQGYCYKEKLAAELADGMYRGLITSMESIKAELNGLQSINRYLDNV